MEFEALRIKGIHGILRYRPSVSRWSAKKRTNHIIGIILDGVAIHDFGYQKFTLSKNCVFFLNQKDDYDVQLQSATSEAYSIHFTTYEPISTDSFCVCVSSPDEILSILEKAEKVHRAENQLLFLSEFYRLCHKLSQLRERTYSSSDTRIQAAKDYMDLHFTEPDCMTNAIRDSNLSARRFGELFRNRFDWTPNRYVNFRKVEYAKTLLSTKAISVTDVAALCGFADVYYFSKVFKNITGITPSKWA